ncbi:MAG: hypothetical protein AAB152_00135 [Candidatus Coatesbacteria bacterium]
MGGAIPALSLVLAILNPSPARTDDTFVTPSLRCSGGWTDNANGGVDDPTAGRPPVPAPFVLVEPGIRIGDRPVPRVQAGAGYRAGVERYRAAGDENAFAHRVDGTVTVEPVGPAWTAEGSWDRKDYPAAHGALSYRAGRGGISASLPLDGDLGTMATAGWALTQWRWPGDRYPVGDGSATAGRADLTNRGSVGIRRRLGSRVVAGLQALWAQNRSRALGAGPAGLRERFSWAGPGAIVSAGVAPSGCTILTVAAQVQSRGYRDWIAGTPPARVTGQALALAASGSWACTRLVSVVADYAYLRHDAADPALRLRAQRVSLGVRIAPRLPL